MPTILDDFPYPWPKREAQQLHVILSQLHPTVPGALLVATQTGLEATMIDSGQPPFFVWADILTMSGKSGLTRLLVSKVFERLNPANPQKPFLKGLLDNRPTLFDDEPRSADGSPGFIRATDDISEPEALLYYDDLTIQTGRLPCLIETLRRLMLIAASVCRLTIDVRGRGSLGTAFRIGSNLLLTNWHVLHDQKTDDRATSAFAEFGYEFGAQGQPLAATVIACDVSSIIGDQADDWAVIRAAEPLNDAWPIIKLSESAQPEEGSAAYIIQHPGGDRKRIGFVRNTITSFDGRVVHYLTDTQAGSSGSPVFNSNGNLVALHHAGGRPQEIAGIPPLKKNEGIHISRIVTGLSREGVEIP